MRILNFGSLNIDTVYEVPHYVSPGETLAATRVSRNVGGKGLNQSVALARAGADVAHAGCIGEDGDLLFDFLASTGADVSHIRRMAGASGQAVIQVDSAGQNSILLYGGANQCITREYIDSVLAHFSAGDMLLLQNEISELAYLIEAGQKKGMTVVLNPSPISPELLAAPLSSVDWFILNEIEGATLADAQDAEKIACVLQKKYPKSKFVMTLGAEGACFFATGEAPLRVAASPVKPVDTTAAGDTFTGYFFATLASGGSVAQALARATRAAGIAVTRAGAAASIPKANEL